MVGESVLMADNLKVGAVLFLILFICLFSFVNHCSSWNSCIVMVVVSSLMPTLCYVVLRGRFNLIVFYLLKKDLCHVSNVYRVQLYYVGSYGWFFCKILSLS